MTIGVPLRLAVALRSLAAAAQRRTIALRVKDDQVDRLLFYQFHGLARAPRLERDRAVARQERGEHFARIGRLVNDQHTRGGLHQCSPALGKSGAAENRRRRAACQSMVRGRGLLSTAEAAC